MTIAHEEMKSEIKDIAPCQKELSVEVPREAVQSETEAVYRDFKKVYAVPGFRVGHAPRDLLERYHGQKARDEVVKRLVSRSLEEALSAQGKLDLVGRPQVGDLKFDPAVSLTYRARLEVAPEVPLGRYKKLALTVPKSEVSDDTVNQVLKRLQENHAELKPLLEPRGAAPGDFLLADLTETPPGKPPLKRRDVILSLDLEKDPDGVLKGLLGMNPGEKRQVTFRDGRVVTVELKGIKVRDLLPLDDSFAKSIGSFDSLDALTAEIRKELRQDSQVSQRRHLEAAATHRLLEEWSFEVPPSLVGSQARRILNERALDLMGRGVPAEKVQEQAQVLADQAKLDALKEVKLFFILRRIAADEKLSATEEEVRQRIEKLAAGLQRSAEEVRRDLEARDLVEEVVWGVIRGKVLELIIREAEIKEES